MLCKYYSVTAATDNTFNVKCAPSKRFTDPPPTTSTTTTSKPNSGPTTQSDTARPDTASQSSTTDSTSKSKFTRTDPNDQANNNLRKPHVFTLILVL